jgi:hypothetical protein
MIIAITISTPRSASLGAIRWQYRAAHRHCGVADEEGDHVSDRLRRDRMRRIATAGSVVSATSRRTLSGSWRNPRSFRSTATTVRPLAARVTAVA